MDRNDITEMYPREMKKQAFLYLVRICLQKVIGFLLYAVGAGFTLTHAGVVYFVILFLTTIINGVILFKANEETLAHRGKIRTNSPKWDRILLPVFWILNYFVVYFMAGFAENGEHLGILYFLGIGLMLLSGWLSTKATLENTYLESTARIQMDRNQKVCTTGPYRIIRHPAYSALILNAVGLSMVFPYLGVWICMAVTTVIIIIRTALEDRMLREGLDGYLDYTKQTKYKLIPFIW